jgi:hypothetical protein
MFRMSEIKRKERQKNRLSIPPPISTGMNFDQSDFVGVGKQTTQKFI